MSSAVHRATSKASKLRSTLLSVRQGTSSQTLPPTIKGITVHAEGLQGNAGVRHFAREVLPAVKHANPHIDVTHARPVSATEGTQPWRAPPGLELTLASEKKVFLPLSGQSSKLADEFWNTVRDPAKVEALADRPAVSSTASPAADQTVSKSRNATTRNDGPGQYSSSEIEQMVEEKLARGDTGPGVGKLPGRTADSTS